MRWILALPALCSLLTAPLVGQVSAFKYQPTKVPLGVVFHYLKTNLDGSNPEHIVQYVAGPDRMEVYKFRGPGTRVAFVTAFMDWQLFTAVRLESRQVTRDSAHLIAVLQYERTQRSVDVTVFGRSEQVTIPMLPFHIYNFDLGSLNLTFGQLRDPTGSFKVGIADPTYKESPVFIYRGEVTIRYVEDTVRDGEDCRVYHIDGPGLDDKGGTIWVRKRDGFAQDMEIALPDNPDWSSFKLRLEQRERMTAEQWAAYLRAHFDQ